MALPLSGTITSAMILSELRITGSGNRLYNIIQQPGGVLQVRVNDSWVNLNMCSPYLPSPISPFIVASDWYGYDHGTSGVESLTISGDTTIDVGQTVTYTAAMTGDNLTGVILRWSKFEAGSWNDNIATGNSLTVTWTDPRDAKIRVVASNICNLNIVTEEINISYNCLPALTGDPYIGGTLEVNKSYDVWAVNGSGIVGTPGNTRLGITFFWEVFGSVQIISGQGTNKVVIRATATSTNNVIRVTITSCGVSNLSANVSFDAASPVVVYYNTAQSASIQKICPSGQVGSYVTVTRAAGTHSSTISVADANSQAVAWLSSQDAQNIAQAQGNCGDTASYPNDRRSQFFTRNNCTSGTGTQVEYVVPANTYFSTSVAAANALAQAEIDANGQNKANAEGQCLVNCNRTVASVGIAYSAGTGYIDVIPSASVSQTGSYSVTVRFGSYNITVSRTFNSAFGYDANNIIRLQCNGTEQIQVTVSSECNSVTGNGDTVTISGSVACTNGLIEIGATRSVYFNGTYTVGMSMGNGNYQNVNNVNGYIELISGGSVLQTNYFGGLDFSGGNTVYQSFNTPVGTHWYVSFKVYITSASNLCTVPQNYHNTSIVEIISPS